MPDYLHECLQRHGEVTRALYGTTQNLQAIERLSARIIDAGHFTYDDVQDITDAGLWRGGMFWQWPTREEINERSQIAPVDDLWNHPRRQNAIVDQLLRIFRHIEPVSVLLRFIDPANFGILSPPVEKVLEIGPAHRPRQKYLKYVKDLRSLREEREFATAAEVDMALWVMHEVIAARVAAGAGNRPVAGCGPPGVGKGDQLRAAEAEVDAAAVDGEALHPLAGSARLDAQHEAAAVDVAAWSGCAHHGGRDGVAA